MIGSGRQAGDRERPRAAVAMMVAPPVPAGRLEREGGNERTVPGRGRGEEKAAAVTAHNGPAAGNQGLPRWASTQSIENR